MKFTDRNTITSKMDKRLIRKCQNFTDLKHLYSFSHQSWAVFLSFFVGKDELAKSLFGQ